MKKLNEEKGYALVLVIAVLSIFTILGLSLMTITTNGIVKNKSRQDNVQATDLADKGIQYMTNDIQKLLKDSLTSGGMSKENFEKLLNNIFNDEKYLCSKNNGYHIAGENGSETNVCIENVVPLNQITNNEKDQLKREVTFRSTGIVNGKEKIVKTKVIFGTDAVPEQLKYTLSTNKDGDLYLHGGVEIKGDVKVDGNLILSEQASWMSGNTAIWEDSVYASIVKNSNSSTPKLIMNPKKNFYVLKTNKKPSFDDHINGNKLDDTKHYTKFSPTNSNESKSFIEHFYNTKNLQIVTKGLENDEVNVSQKVTSKKNQKGITKHKDLKITSNSNENKNPLKNLDKSKEVFIEHDTYCSDWFIVCWKYSDTNALTINGNNSEINLTGQLYLDGNLEISNTKLKSDALIYVDGDVTIKNSTLFGLDNNSTLIIFATGEIHISNISEYQDTASKIKGFFYTQNNMIMYGVGSNIELQGGISAKRLILTAVRGNTKKENGKLTVDSIAVQKQKPSRLTIIYDQNLISEYTEFKRNEETELITELSDPEIIERKY